MDAPLRMMYRVDRDSKAQIRAALLEHSGQFDAELMSVASLVGSVVNTADQILADGSQCRLQVDRPAPTSVTWGRCTIRSSYWPIHIVA